MSHTIEVTEHVNATPVQVWPYFTDATLYARWMGTEVEIVAEPGGVFSATMQPGLRASGTFLELEPPRRLVFTWGWDHDAVVTPGSTRVEVLLEPVGDGTLVRLRHHDLPDQDACDHHTMGWTNYLARLAIVVDGGDPGPDPNAA